MEGIVILLGTLMASMIAVYLIGVIVKGDWNV